MKAKNMTTSALVRDAVLERIEDEIDLQFLPDLKATYRKQLKKITFDEVMIQSCLKKTNFLQMLHDV
ncbi:DUF6290 family protein [Exiguobacterium sp. FSL W8-0210]|uniref:DUF6290 family protein n=1 Tax=Exiguobacterium sp. FSL W8-0210 TaxID=2921598 RepID=UPI0030FAB6FF